MLLSFFALALLVLAPVGAAAPAAPAASAQSPASPVDIARSRLDTMLRTGHAEPSWFSAGFLAKVPAGKVDEVIASLTSALGPYRSLEFTPTMFVAHFAKGTDDVLIHLDASDAIDGLLFRPPAVATSSLDEALRALQPAAGMLSYVVIVGGSERAVHDGSASLAVGSAFKLAVLNALRDQVRYGQRHWSDVVPLDDRWKSAPTGVLQTWPAGTPITIATYAAEMISISDNTAADALVRLVGPAALRPYAARNDPFLTTREMVTLKSRPGSRLRAAYLAAGTPAARLGVLRRADALPLPALGALSGAPDLSVEWHYSVRELCGLMQRVADLPLMSINPGVADPSRFRHVAFKGGSEAGTINLTTAVTTRRGTSVCFSATLNDPSQGVDESAFEAAYAGVLRHLADL